MNSAGQPLPGAQPPTGDGAHLRPGADLLGAGAISAAGWSALLDDSARLKAEWDGRHQHVGQPLRGRAVALVFEHPSLRTRISTELAIGQLGGQAVYLVGVDVGLGRRESAHDVARALGTWVAAIVARTIHHETLQEMADATDVPVINGLTDREHPLQAAADVLTIAQALGGVAGRIVTFVGDGNNVAASLAIAVTSLGGHMRLACPPGYRPPEDLLGLAAARGAATGGGLELREDPAAAAKGADILYTDVWTSMGQEGERAQRRHDLARFSIDAAMLARAAPGARVMHCLPAHRGEEISAEVLEGPRSLVLEQAANRLPTAKAVLAAVLSYPAV
ncbi:MAG: ornithine carbamoyltransferase [Candidatus Limnocylindrales bacterium]